MVQAEKEKPGLLEDKVSGVDLSGGDVIHFVHVPKCGGKSFKQGLELAYQDDVTFFYLNPMPIFRRRAYRRVMWKLKNMFAPQKSLNSAQIIYGHFCFDDLPLPKNRTLRRGAFFRDPVEWVGSYYFYARSKYSERFSKDPIGAIKAVGLDRGFRKFLGHVRVDDLDFVGLQEDYATGLRLFEAMFGKTIPYTEINKTVNKSGELAGKTSYREYFAENGLLGDIEEVMKDNFEIYEAAVARYRILVDQYELAD